MQSTLKVLSLALAASLAAVAPSHAARSWKESHPGRAHVNQRLKNQNKRISQGVKDGQLTKKEARQMRRSDKRVRGEERRMARRDDDKGHLTKGQLRKLNRRENRDSRRIYKERHEGQGNAAEAPPAGSAPAPAPAAGQ